MTESIEITEEAVDSTTEENPKVALLFELESLAINGRKISFDVVKAVLADKDVALTPALFSRYCLNSSVAQSIPALLQGVGKARAATEKLTAEIAEDIKLSLVEGSVRANSAISAIIQEASSETVSIGVLSAMDDKTAGKLMDKVGLDESNAQLFLCDAGDRQFPSADAWLKLAKSMEVSPSLCMVLATSAASCKAALSAGMRCAVIPDEFTSFQDFGGADYVVDQLDLSVFKSLFELVHAHQCRI